MELTESQLELLKHSTNENTEFFSFNNTKKIGKVVSVYDGDTCRIVLYLESKIVKFHCRMNGYDSPEMKPRLNVENRDEIIIKAKEARDYLKSLVNDKIVEIQCGDFDKYGRLLVDIYIEGKNVNNDMISNGYGYVYNGGTKR